MKPFRFFQLCAVLPIAFHVVSAAPITFQVDLSVQKALGNFDPANDTIIAAGTFDNWSTSQFTLNPSAANANIYTGTFDDAVDASGSTMQYKFIINRSGTLNWESRNNRTASVSGSSQTLPVVFFNDVSSSARGGKVTYTVNMKVQTELGTFQPDVDQVFCAGTFDNWAASQFVLTNSPANPSVYSGTFDESAEPAGSTVQYKFIISSAANGLVWESLNNRSFVLPGAATNLPAVYFNNLTNNPGSGVPVTFQVNVAVLAAQGTFSPDTDAVSVAGAFNNWNTSASPLTNSPANPYLFRGTFKNITDAPGSAAQFKFVINGAGWETGDNRTFVLSPPSQVLPVLFYNNVNALGRIDIARGQPAQVSLSWTALAAGRLQRSADLKAWQDVPNTLGADAASFFTTTNRAQFFRTAGP